MVYHEPSVSGIKRKQTLMHWEVHVELLGDWSWLADLTMKSWGCIRIGWLCCGTNLVLRSP